MLCQKTLEAIGNDVHAELVNIDRRGSGFCGVVKKFLANFSLRMVSDGLR